MRRIVARRATRLSPWVTLVETDVESPAGVATYHGLAQADYVGVLARTPAGLIPIVRQLRPAAGEETWELPGGLVDDGEEPAATARRELLEETGLAARRLVALGSHWAEPGRLANRHHAFFAECDEQAPGFIAEEGVSVRFVDMDELRRMAAAGELSNLLHVAVLALYELRRP